MTPQRPEYGRRTPSSISIAPPSKDSRQRQQLQSSASPRDALRSRQQSYGFPRQPAKPAPQTIRQVPQSPEEWSHSTSDLQQRDQVDPIPRRLVQQPSKARQGQPMDHQLMSSSTQALVRPLPSPHSSASTEKSPERDNSLIGAEMSRFASAPPTVPLRATARQRLREVVSRNVSSVDWTKLPSPVWECILSQLRTLHLGQQSRSCNTCHMRDLVALRMTCRTWSAFAQNNL